MQEEQNSNSNKELSPKPRSRRNGRNRSAKSKATNNAGVAKLECGEVANTASFQEKISGKNATGYKQEDNQSVKSTKEISENASTSEENSEEVGVQKQKSAKPQRDHKTNKATRPNKKGLVFENNKEFKGNSIEVKLKYKGQDKQTEGKSQDLGLLARIKKAIKKLFGSSKQAPKKNFKSGNSTYPKRQYNKNKNWKNGDAGNKYNNGKRPNNYKNGKRRTYNNTQNKATPTAKPQE